MKPYPPPKFSIIKPPKGKTFIPPIFPGGVGHAYVGFIAKGNMVSATFQFM